MSIINIDNIRRLFKRKDYEFHNEDGHVNVFGIRSISKMVNLFNDKVGILVRIKGKQKMYLWKATTDPGLYWLKNLMNPKGTAILLEGQYRNAYKIGLHKGKYEALVQRNGAVTVIRDNNKNDKLDYGMSLETGYFGINIHRASKFRVTEIVGRWSAGCQAIQKYDDFMEFMELCRTSKSLYGNTFNYTLFNEKDLYQNIPIEQIPIMPVELLSVA